MSNRKYAAYKAAAPYFDLVRGALGDLVDGDHFFDIVADDVVYEVLYDFPGWPRRIQGRADLMAQFRGYVDNIALQSADNLFVHIEESRDDPKILQVDDAEIIGDGRREFVEPARHVLAQKSEDGVSEVAEFGVGLVVGDVLVHHQP